MTISPALALSLVAAWLAGVGSLGLYFRKKIVASKAQGFFDNGLGTRISQAEQPKSFGAAVAIYWIAVGGTAVLFLGGMIVIVVMVFRL